MFLDSESRHGGEETQPPPCPVVLSPIRPAWSIISLDGELDDFALSMDLEVLTRPDQIMELARVAAEYSREKSRPKSYWLPGIPQGTGISERIGSFNPPGIEFPRDERLHLKAHEWSKSKNVHIRLISTQVFGLDRTGENIAILKDLLHDPGFINGCYPVRLAVQKLLSEWNVEGGEVAPRSPSDRKGEGMR